jgi:hypothetical protein
MPFTIDRPKYFLDLTYPDYLTIPSFLAYNNAVITNVTGDGTSYTIIYNTEDYDIGGGFNTTTGTFTAPVAGKYMFRTNITLDDVDTVNNTTYYASINCTAGSVLISSGSIAAMAGTGTRVGFSGSAILDLAAGNTCAVVVNVSGQVKGIDIAASALPGTARSTFAGFRIG